MALNLNSKVQDLGELATRWKCQQVIAISINTIDGTFQVISYGINRDECNKAKLINEEIYAKIISSDIQLM
jgi:hypothetical protein